MKSIVCLLVGFVILFGFSCSLGSTQCFTPESCDDPDWISQVGDSYSYRLRNAVATEDSITIEFKGFNGRDTVWELTSCDNVSIPCELDIRDLHAMTFKIVLVHEDTAEISTIYRYGSEEQSSIELEPGRYTIKLIGHDAQGRIRMGLDVPPGVLAIDRFTDRW